jgi:hypothetical protein
MKQIVTAQINTKSNFRNLNGQWLEVVQMSGTRVTCLVQMEGKFQSCDFNIKEIAGFQFNNQ